MGITTRRKTAFVAASTMTAVAAASPGAAAFSAFVAPSTTPPRRPSQRWNVVTPISATRKSSSSSSNKKKKNNMHVNDGEGSSTTNLLDDDVPTTKRKRKRQTKIPKPPSPPPPTASIDTSSITQSFGAVTATTYKSHGKYVDPEATPVDIHTLILGTHPSIQSLEKTQYYGHPVNAFWWIAGDCLGFRRDMGRSKSTGLPYKFASELRFDESDILPTYEEQLQALTSKGFALWDIVQSCHRDIGGSLDSAICEDEPNAIPAFCVEHRHSLRRIVLANGTSGWKFFKKHFGTWMDESSSSSNDNNGEGVVVKVVRGEDDLEKLLLLVEARAEKDDDDLTDDKSSSSTSPSSSSPVTIWVIPALAVSPAAARHSYAEKRDFWDKYVYQPGLNDHYLYSSSDNDGANNNNNNNPVSFSLDYIANDDDSSSS